MWKKCRWGQELEESEFRDVQRCLRENQDWLELFQMGSAVITCFKENQHWFSAAFDLWNLGFFSAVQSWIRAVQSWIRAVESWIRAVETWIRAVERWIRAVESWIRAVQRFPDNEQRWIRTETFWNHSWSPLICSGTSTRKGFNLTEFQGFESLMETSLENELSVKILWRFEI